MPNLDFAKRIFNLNKNISEYSLKELEKLKGTLLKKNHPDLKIKE